MNRPLGGGGSATPYTGRIFSVECSPGDRLDAVTVRVRGEIDLASAPRLRAALLDVDRRGHRYVEVDLGAVDLVDSAGIGVLIGALRRARLAGGDLRIISVAADTARVFGLLRLDAVFGLVGTAHADAGGGEGHR